LANPAIKSAVSIIKASSLASLAETFRPFLKPSIRVSPSVVDMDEIKIGGSRFGGDPDVWAQFQWPRHKGQDLTFLAQIDLKQIHKYDTDNLLPPEGWLLFFYAAEKQDAWGGDPQDRTAFRVLFLDCDRKKLVRHPCPETDASLRVEFNCCRLGFNLAAELPSLPETMGDEVVRLIKKAHPDEDEALEMYSRLLCDLHGHGPEDPGYHHLLGYAQEIQGDMESECRQVTRGLFPKDEGGLQGSKGKNDWMLLFQIDTDEDGPGWMWGDSGRLYFWIRRQDLNNRNFENAWMILQCY
jgi:uncharacterized protein YwqG